MLRRLAPAAALLALAAAPLRAQLGLITVPRGSLRIDISGAFYPNDESWVNGTKQPVGSFVDGATNPAATGLQASLSALLGQPVAGLSLGGITAIASRDHGVGDLGFAYGLSKRITIFGNLPIVYVRSHITMAFDPTTSRVGINPANPRLGTADGQRASTLFIGDFDVAIDTLKFRIQQSYYSGATATLAQATLASATAMRAALNTLLVDPLYASPVLPTTSDPATAALLAKITTLQSTLNGSLALPKPFNSTPAFPDATLSATDFQNLLDSPAGLALASPNNLPHYGLGDMSAGVAFELSQQGSPGVGTWRSVWLRATGKFPNGTQPDPSLLLDEGTGAKRKSIEVDGIAEYGHHGIGIRGEASFLHALPANSLTRPTAADQLLVPPGYLTAITTQAGDSIAITVRPWINFAQHLAVSGMLQYWRRGMSTTTYLAGQAPVPNVDPSLLDAGSNANAVVAAIGLSYFHDGRAKDGTVALPLEAGWSIERTLTSSSGIFPVALTSRLYLRIYRPLITH